MNGEDKHTVAELRAFYQGQINERKREIEQFEEKLKMLEVFSADAKHIHALRDKYQDTGLTEAVKDAVKSLHEIGVENPDGVEAYDVFKYLCEHGFKGTENLPTAVHVTLKRLGSAHDGRLIMTKDKYLKRFYKPGKQISGNGSGR